MYITIYKVKLDVDARFTEDAYKRSVTARDAVKAIHALVPMVSKAKEAVLPKETMLNLKNGRVA